jgi:methionyl-tRNA synthetase
MSILYDDFSKLEIRIGTVVSVEVVPDADKLLRLCVDLGEEEPRQIISGIRLYLEDPQEIVGKQFPFLANLEPRTIRGFVSNGMILAANAGDTFAFLNPSTPLPPGTLIK